MIRSCGMDLITCRLSETFVYTALATAVNTTGRLSSGPLCHALGAGRLVPKCQQQATHVDYNLWGTLGILKPPAPVTALDRRFEAPKAGVQRGDAKMALTLMSSVNAVVKP